MKKYLNPMVNRFLKNLELEDGQFTQADYKCLIENALGMLEDDQFLMPAHQLDIYEREIRSNPLEIILMSAKLLTNDRGYPCSYKHRESVPLNLSTKDELVEVGLELNFKYLPVASELILPGKAVSLYDTNDAKVNEAICIFYNDYCQLPQDDDDRRNTCSMLEEICARVSIYYVGTVEYRDGYGYRLKLKDSTIVHLGTLGKAIESAEDLPQYWDRWMPVTYEGEGNAAEEVHKLQTKV